MSAHDIFGEPEEPMLPAANFNASVELGTAATPNLIYGFPIANTSFDALDHPIFPGQSTDNFSINTGTAFCYPSNSACPTAPQSLNHFIANGDLSNQFPASPFFADYAFPYTNLIADPTQPPPPSIINSFDGSIGIDNSTSISATDSVWNGPANMVELTDVTHLAIPHSIASSAASTRFNAQSNIVEPTAATRLAISPRTAPSAASTRVNAQRFTCSHPGCTTTFGRVGDLERHRKKHSPPEHPCLINGCDRKGRKAFHRLDKLHDHQRKRHGATAHPKGNVNGPRRYERENQCRLEGGSKIEFG